jgi:hypothetical protein
LRRGSYMRVVCDIDTCVDVYVLFAQHSHTPHSCFIKLHGSKLPCVELIL